MGQILARLDLEFIQDLNVVAKLISAAKHEVAGHNSPEG